jgi:hypothetical protein
MSPSLPISLGSKSHMASAKHSTSTSSPFIAAASPSSSTRSSTGFGSTGLSAIVAPADERAGEEEATVVVSADGEAGAVVLFDELLVEEGELLRFEELL